MRSLIFCRCDSGECIHKSDCAVHNEPAEEAGMCTCLTSAEKRALPGSHYSDGRRYSHISKAWILDEQWNDREESARLRAEIARISRELNQAKECANKIYAAGLSARNHADDAAREIERLREALSMWSDAHGLVSDPPVRCRCVACEARDAALTVKS